MAIIWRKQWRQAYRLSGWRLSAALILLEAGVIGEIGNLRRVSGMAAGNGGETKFGWRSASAAAAGNGGMAGVRKAWFNERRKWQYAHHGAWRGKHSEAHCG